MAEIEEEVYKDLEEAETVADVFDAMDKLKDHPRTAKSHALTSAAGTLIAQGINNKTQKEDL